MDQSYVQYQNEVREDYEDDNPLKKSNFFRKYFCSRTGKGLIFLILFAIAVPLLIYYLVVDRGSYQEIEVHTCLIENSFRILCGEANATSGYCESIDCCFDSSLKRCYHYLPSKYYFYTDESSDKYHSSRKLSPFETESLEEISIAIDEIDENRVKIILHDSNVKFENNTITDNKNYNVTLYKNPLSIEIYRNKNNHLLLTTSKGPLIASPGYWEWSFYLTNEYLFGCGETLIKVDENSTLTKIIYKNKVDHNTVPVFMAYQERFFHGLIVRHIGPLEISILPSNVVSVKSLVGIKIELELSLGPTPEAVFFQQKQIPFTIPPKWALGAHICRGGSSTSIEEILDEYDNFRSTNAYLEYESDCIHENLFMAIQNVDDTQRIRLLSVINDLRYEDKKFILSLPPQIVYNSTLYFEALRLDLLIKQYNGSIYQGSYLNEKVVYPDFSHPSIDNYVTTLLTEINAFFENQLDGLILTDNWPSDESFVMSKTEQFPYLSKELIEAMSITLPWNTTISTDILHLTITNHNLYGSLQLEGIKRNVHNDSTSLIMSSSYDYDFSTNPLTLQNVNISWFNLKNTIKTILSNSLFGNPLLSVPICGSTDAYDKELDESLCMRWYLMAVTMPIFRISSDFPRRDPNSLNTQFASDTALKAIKYRSLLLPYFYTVLNENKPFIRPMFYDFYADNNTFELDEQFMVGDELLIAHPFVPNKFRLRIYLPPSVSGWYEFFNGNKYVTSTGNGWITLNIVETDWISFVKAGSIVPLVEIDKLSSNTIVNMIVALNCTENNCEATGKLLVGSNYLTFISNENSLEIQGITDEAKLDMNCTILSKFVVEQISIYSEKTLFLDKSEDLCQYEKNMSIIYN